MHGGQVGVNSSGVEGEGSEFWVMLPEFPVHETALPVAIAAEHQQTILMLFQSPVDPQQLRERLGQQQVKLLEAPLDRPEEWQKLLAITPPQAIILELDDKSNLPWRAMKMIKELPSVQEIPVMFYRASAEGESLLKFDYLTKPLEPGALLRALDQNLTLADPEAGTVRTFLVVDDDINTLEMHARLLRLHSAENRVLAAQSGSEALNFLLTEKVDLVLLDLQMPEMDGFAVLQAMHEAPWTRSIPVIVITGRELTEEDLSRLQEGVAVVLQKGMFAANETIAHINSVLQQKRHLSMNAQRLVRLAMLYIHENYAEPITRGEIARHINIAEDYLTFCFRQELGTTPIKYVQRYRIHQAKKMLKETALTVTEIALAVGFRDSGYFSRIFHRETGLPPETFRRS
jgi:AraC-like DNA-binding protein